ncbi:MAG: ribonucleotide reductase N-terminal alpha domain-containing protein, partial [Candidatus Zixiibacteriota bacterium]
MEEKRKLDISENSLKVLERRYLKKDDEGKISETPVELFRRVAKAIALPEKKFGATPEEVIAYEGKFFNMMSSMEFMPNSPTLMNAGRPLGQLSACFVLPIDDSMESIFDAVKHTALIHKSGGG